MKRRKHYKGFLDKAKATAKRVPIWGWALGGAAALLLLIEGGGELAMGTDLIGGAFDWAKSEAFAAALPSYARQYADVILQVAKETGVSPALIYAIGDRESGWGRYLDADDTGDSGHGRGLMQIDDRTWSDWLDSNDWKDPYTNVSFAISHIFIPQRTELANDLGWPDATTNPPSTQADLDRAAIVAYNHGVAGAKKNIDNGSDWDTGTTGGNYSADVLAKVDSIMSALA